MRWRWPNCCSYAPWNPDATMRRNHPHAAWDATSHASQQRHDKLALTVLVFGSLAFILRHVDPHSANAR